MDRDRQELSQQPAGSQGPQSPAGWQQERKQPGTAPRPPRQPLAPNQNVPLPPNQYPPNQPNIPARYSEPIADMGTTLGYGQGMEYQYFDVPQPSQPMPKLRMERLQQLRQERLRRDVQHSRPDVTSFIQRRKSNPSQQLNAVQLPLPPTSSKLAVPPSKSASKALTPPTPAVQPAIEPAQDTAMLKKVRIGRASAILMAAFVASRVLGLVRTSMFAATFGTNNISDAFVQASLIPDTIFNIVAGGALASAFIPIFTKYMVGENDENTGWRIANAALTLSVAFMVALALVGAIFADPLVWLINPGYHTGPHGPETLHLIAMLVRIMFIQAIILGGGVIVTSVLNAQNNFQLPAIGTVLYNVGNILGLAPGLFLAIIGHPNPTLAVYCAAIGVVLGAALNIGIQVPGLRKVGMNYKPNFDWRIPGVLQIGHQMIPRIFNASVASFTIILDRFLIGLLGVILIGGATIDGLTTQYYQATQLVMLPLGIFGMAMSTAAFPTLAEYVAKGRMDRARSIILETLRSILFLSIPSSIGLIVLAVPIIQVLLAHGRYNVVGPLQADPTSSTAIALGFYSLGLAGMAAVEILTRSFYAMRDSRTPVIISILQFAWKIAVGLVILNPFVILGNQIAGNIWAPSWGMGALALSTSLANLAEAVVLFIVLDQRIGELLKSGIAAFILRVLAASSCMGIVILVTRILLEALTSHLNPHGLLGFLSTVIKLTIELLVGTFIYLRAARFFKLEELGPVRRLLDRFKLSWML